MKGLQQKMIFAGLKKTDWKKVNWLFLYAAANFVDYMNLTSTLTSWKIHRVSFSKTSWSFIQDISPGEMWKANHFAVMQNVLFIREGGRMFMGG